MKPSRLLAALQRSLFICILTTAFATLGMSAYLLYKADQLPQNFWVNGISVADLTVDEALLLIQENLPSSIHINFWIENELWQEDILHLDEIKAHYPAHAIQTALRDALQQRTFGERLAALQQTKQQRPRYLEFVVEYDLDALRRWVDLQAHSIRRDPIYSEVAIEQGKIKVREGIDGLYLQAEPLLEQLQERIANHEFSDINFPLTRIKIEEVLQGRDDFSQPLSAFTTTLDDHHARRQNIQTASRKINGYRLAAEAVFSFNQVVGHASLTEGYQLAPVIINGQLREDAGGGICQLSTNLYQAALRAGFKIIERHSHSLPVGYVPVGMDAAIAYGHRDLQLQNPYAFPVLLLAWLEDAQLHTAIYGPSAFSPPVIRVQSRHLEEIPPPTRTVVDPTLKPGARFVEQPGSPGYRVSVYRLRGTRKTEYAQERISVDYYRPTEQIIRVGAH